MSITVKKIKLFPDHFLNRDICLQGWIKHNRCSGGVGFLVLVDGSSLEGLQLVYKKEKLVNFQQISKVLPGSAIQFQGKIIKSKNPKESVEVVVSLLEIIAPTQNDYFLQKKRHSNEFLRTKSDLRARSQLFHCLFKIRSNLFKIIHDFFAREGFLQLSTPIIGKNDCEGGGEGFLLNQTRSGNKEFFNQAAILSVSGQLHAEAFAQCYKKVYSLGPVFRAEKSDTKFHSAEFWMLEPEVAFAKKEDGILLSTNLIKDILERVYFNNQKELHFLSDLFKINLLQRIENLTRKEFYKITYTQALTILNQKKLDKEKITWGMDLTKEQEMLICAHFQNQPVFITDYPEKIKPFYMKKNMDQKTVACFDLLLPDVGEIIGGSERESSYQKIVQNAKDKGVNIDNIEWYLNLRLQGYSGSTGFGLGIDRLLMFITGVENIRDVIPFFSGYKNLKF